MSPGWEITLRRAWPVWLSGWLLVTPLRGQTPAPVSTTVTYVSGGSVYVGIGRLSGLAEGAQLDLIRAGRVVGSLQVAFLSSHQASCTVVTASSPVAVGDSVRFVPAAGTTVLAQDSSARGSELADSVGRTVAPRAATRSADGRVATGRRPIRGRVGTRFLSVQGRDSAAVALSQPALELRLEGEALGRTPIGVIADVRTRRTITSLAGSPATRQGLTRVYLMAVSLFRSGSPGRLAIGRQLSPALAPVSYFDGVLASWDRSQWGAGLFGGTQPGEDDLSFSTDIRQAGGYVQLHSRPEAAARWMFTLGGVGSYQAGQPNREFGFAQWSFSSRHVSTYVTQELDWYRGAKLELGEAPLSLTNTFASASIRVGGSLTLDGGFDNRRSVRLYRDLVTPLTVFDDSFRRGAWGGATVRFARHFRVGADLRTSAGGMAGGARAYTLSLGATGLTPLRLSFRSRSTRFINQAATGWLHSASLELAPTSWLQVGANGGRRVESANAPAGNLTWLGLDLDLTLTRQWYVTLSAARETGRLQGSDQFYGGMTWRF